MLEAGRLPPDQRDAFVARACGDDPELRAEVESLLRHHDKPLDALKTPALQMLVGSGAKNVVDGPIDDDEAVPEHIGRYRVIRKISEGGMGVVFEAQQDNPRRTVALKIIRRGLGSPVLIQRFQREIELLGQLQHAGIAQIHEAGTADVFGAKLPYFAMEFIQGIALDQYAQAQRLSVRARLALLARVCDAVQHAHQKGVVHRDLKPSNILVVPESTENKTSGEDPIGQPKILDFGVARATDADLLAITMQTDVGQIVGTIPYMSPEQVTGRSESVDTRSDVYSLGVVLYELLAGKLPYPVTGVSITEAARTIRETEPRRLSTVDRALRGDIETIVAKALDKDRERRYTSASELAADIRRYLADEPIIARPPSATYQLRKFARRNRALVGGIALAVLVLLAGTITTTLYAVREARQRTRAEYQTAEAALQAEIAESVRVFLVNDLLLSADPRRAGRDVRVVDALERAARHVESSFRDKPKVEAEIQSIIGQVYRSLGLFEEGEPHLRRALALQRQLMQPHDTGLARTIQRLALLLADKGEFEEAERLARESLDIYAHYPVEEVPDLASALHLLGNVLRKRGQLEEAEMLVRRALALHRTHRSDTDVRVITTSLNLVSVLLSKARYSAAESLARDLVPIIREELGDNHPHYATCLTNLANALAYQGQFDESTSRHREAIAIYRERYGDANDRLAIAINNLGRAYQLQGDCETALEVFDQALAVFRNAVGEEHASYSFALGSYGQCLQQLGRLEQAEQVQRQTLAIRRNALGADHALVGMAMLDLGVLRGLRGSEEEAVELCEEGLALTVSGVGESHPWSIKMRHRLALVYQDAGRLHKARDAYEELIGTLDGPNDAPPYVAAEAYYDASKLFRTAGNPDEADRCLALARDALTTISKAKPDLARKVKAELQALSKSRGESR